MRLAIQVSASFIALTAAMGLFGFAVPAAAAPDNKHTESEELICDGLGEITVTDNNSEAAVVFGPGGQVLVGKALSFTADTTVAIPGGPTITFTDEGGEGSTEGKGFEDRLVECEGSGEFTDKFTLDEETIAFLEAVLVDQGTPTELDAFLGATATATGTFTSTLLLLIPGK